MPYTPTAIIVEPAGNSVSVTIKQNSSGGAVVAAYTAENGESLHSFPKVVASQTTFWLTGQGTYYVGLTIAGVEAGSTVVTVDPYQRASVVPSVAPDVTSDAARFAPLADASLTGDTTVVRFGAGIQAPTARTPFGTLLVVDSSTAGDNDFVVHALQAVATNSGWASAGSADAPDPGWFFGLNQFTATGASHLDGDGLIFLGNVIESDLRSDATVERVVGLIGEAAAIGSAATGKMLRMVGVQATQPKNKSGSAATADFGYSLQVDAVHAGAHTTLTTSQAANSSTLTVVSTKGFASSGTLHTPDTVTGTPPVIAAGQTITYTGKTSFTFTGCTGGTSATLAGGSAIGDRSGDMSVVEGYSLNVVGGHSFFGGQVQVVGEFAIDTTGPILIVRHAPSGTGNLQEWQRSDGSLLGRTDSSGVMAMGNGVVAWESLTGQVAIGRQTVDTVASAAITFGPLQDSMLYQKTAHSRKGMVHRKSNGSDRAVGAPIYDRTWWQQTPNNTAVRTAGMGAGSTTGTITQVAAAATVPVTNNLASAASTSALATAGTNGGSGMTVLRGASSDVYAGWKFIAQVLYPDASYNSSGTTTGSRLCVGMFATAATMYGADRGGTQDLAYFSRAHVNGGASDTNWQFVTNDNTGPATVADTGCAFTVSHLYEFTIWCPAGSSSVYWQVDDLTAATSFTGTATDTLPRTTAAMLCAAGLSTIDATARNVRIARMFLETDKG